MSLVTIAPASRASRAARTATSSSTSSTCTTLVAAERVDRQLRLAQPQLIVAIPQHHAVAGVFVDEDHREAVFDVADDEAR